MTETPFEGVGNTWAVSVSSGFWSYVDIWTPFRVFLRLTGIVLWAALILAAMTCTIPVAWFSPRGAQRLRKRISYAWLRGGLALLGTRVTVRGTPPAEPFFLIGNHISWMDFFVTNTLVDAVCVSDVIASDVPIIRFLLKGMDLIIVTRTREKLVETNELMVRAMEAGKSIIMAPEATVSPGRRVCHFHSGLFESAVRVGRPVHYASLTVRTPHGWPPPTRSILAHDPVLPIKDPTPEESELMRYQNERGFLRYFLGLLSLPWHEYIVTFAPEPIVGTDRKQLAKDLRQAVESIFTPVE
jgi:1-acyl-sn-glycerol-3-phosphate acyltransferase